MAIKNAPMPDGFYWFDNDGPEERTIVKIQNGHVIVFGIDALFEATDFLGVFQPVKTPDQARPTHVPQETIALALVAAQQEIARLQEELKAVKELPELPRCPHCNGGKITKIYRPEVYEFAYICKECHEGFNA